MNIEVNVSNKIAKIANKNTVAVCGNSDYVVQFAFDDEWKVYETKTARFKWNGSYTDVTFTGSVIAKNNLISDDARFYPVTEIVCKKSKTQVTECKMQIVAVYVDELAGTILGYLDYDLLALSGV